MVLRRWGLLLKSLLPAVALVGCLSCGPGADSGIAPREAAPVALPAPRLDDLAPEVREHIDARRAELEPVSDDPSGSDETRADAWGQLGKLYHAYGMTELAGPSYRNAEILDPGNYRWPYYRGLVLLRQENLEDAHESFVRVTRLEPGFAPARIRLGQVALELNRLDEAAAEFEHALVLEPGGAAARYGLGRVLAARNENEGAVRRFESALASQPGATRIHYALAQAYRNLGRMDEARRHLELFAPGQVVVGDVLLAELSSLVKGEAGHLDSGRVAMRLGLIERGVEEYRKAVEARPQSAEAHAQLASALARQDRIDDALLHGRRALELEPDRPARHLQLAALYGSSGRNREAMNLLRSSLELDPGDKLAHLRLAARLDELDLPDESLQHYRAALRLDPHDPMVFRRMSAALVRRGRKSEAVEVLREWVEASPEAAKPRVDLAMVLTELDEVPEALEQLRRAVDLEGTPRTAALARFGLGVIASRRGQPREALERYRSAVEVDPTFDAARLALGNALTLSSEYRDAVDALRPFADRSPDIATAAARLLATCPDDSVRDGREAVRLAESAVRARSSPDYVETLAMALAEVGDFDAAVRRQTELVAAAEKFGDDALAAQLRANLRSYERGEPVRAPWKTP